MSGAEVQKGLLVKLMAVLRDGTEGKTNLTAHRGGSIDAGFSMGDCA